MPSLMVKIDYSTFPGHCEGGMRRWIENAIPPGHFLTAVLENNLKEAIGRADDVNQRLLPDIVKWIYNNAPFMCWGSPEKVKEWQARGGLKAITDCLKSKEE